MNVITTQLARLSAVILFGSAISSCVVSPPMPPPPGGWDDSGPPPSAPADDHPDTGASNPGGSTPTPPATGQEEYPLAKPTKNPDQVISPYEPYNVIDISGFHSGQLARDPSNRKIFRIP